MSQEQVFLRRSDFARRIGVSAGTVGNWVHRELEEPGTGVRSIVFPGGERRIPESEVVRILGGFSLS